MGNTESILVDIDTTLDQLICNADAINRITDRPLFATEVKAMHKTQESLMARLVHMHDLYETEKKVIGRRAQKMRINSIEHKLVELGKLNARVIEHLEASLCSKSKASIKENRKKAKAAVAA